MDHFPSRRNSNIEYENFQKKDESNSTIYNYFSKSKQSLGNLTTRDDSDPNFIPDSRQERYKYTVLFLKGKSGVGKTTMIESVCNSSHVKVRNFIDER